MTFLFVKMGVELKVVTEGDWNLIMPTESCTPTKKAKEGHDLHFSVQPSMKFFDADKVVAEPMGAMPKALNASKYDMMSSFSNPFWTQKIHLDYIGDPLNPQFVMDPDCNDKDLVSLIRWKRNSEGEIKEFKYRKASAEGCVKQWQGFAANPGLNRHSIAMGLDAQRNLLGAEFAAEFAADCQKSIDVHQAQLDQVNKRLKHLRR